MAFTISLTTILGWRHKLISFFRQETRDIITWILGVIVALGTIYFTYGKIFHQPPKEIVRSDLTPVFNNQGIHRVDLIPDSDNIQKLKNEFDLAQDNIKIVTIDGGTWLRSNIAQEFEHASKRIPVTVLMMNYGDPKITDIWNYVMSTYGTSSWDVNKFLDSLRYYQGVFDRSKSRLNIGLYNLYPWTRFTIFDDKAVSFIITPLIKGDTTPKYFSEDPSVVHCFEVIYQEFLDNSNSAGNTFKTYEQYNSYVSLWEKKASEFNNQ